ncbi:MAG: dihydroorotase [Nitrosopumilus sp. B06]|nr:MAG: dihydroorotase [Nitrosopumilus sp. B06]
MTYDMVVADSHVMLPQGMVERNILVQDGKIAGFSTDIPSCDKKIDGRGLVSVPGPIDTHMHYGVYSPIEKAAQTESHAAAIGGITTMMRMLRLGGPFSESLQPQLDAASKNHYIDYAAHASIFSRQQIKEMRLCVDGGVTSFKLYMNLGGEVGHVYMDVPPGSSGLAPAQVEVTDDIVEETVRTAASLRCPVLVHAEDYEACGCGMRTAREKKRDGLSAWSESRPPESEAKAIRTVSEFGRRYNCVIYFVHVGSARALEQIKKEKKLGTCIFVETCPHYLTLSHEGRGDYLAKVMPPLRAQQDLASVWAALADTIDTIGTDHVANRLSLKLGGEDVWGALAGFPGTGTMMPLLLHYGINQNRITLEQLVCLTSSNAARIFGMTSKGRLEKGADADIAMLDLKMEKTVSAEMFGGFSDYTVYEGQKLCGWPVKTVVRGSMISEDFEVIGKTGYGRLVPRSI